MNKTALLFVEFQRHANKYWYCQGCHYHSLQAKYISMFQTPVLIHTMIFGYENTLSVHQSVLVGAGSIFFVPPNTHSFILPFIDCMQKPNQINRFFVWFLVVFFVHFFCWFDSLVLFHSFFIVLCPFQCFHYNMLLFIIDNA